MPNPLMTKELEQRFERYPLYSQDGKLFKALCSAKLFSLTGWTWFLTEYDPAERIAFGFCIGPDPEWGYTALSELEGVNAARQFPIIECDEFFTPKTVAEALVELGRSDLIP